MNPSPVSPPCPVPTEQQPIHEYEAMREAWLFCWAVADRLNYIRNMIWVWLLSWIVSGPLAAASFPPAKQLMHFVLSSSAGAGAVVLLVLLRIYSGWLYVRGRLTNETVEYEESGWYDGQRWTKTAAVLSRDRLVASYQVKPVLDRLQRSFVVLAAVYGIGGAAWFIL